MSNRVLGFVGGLALIVLGGAGLLFVVLAIILGLSGYGDLDLWTLSGSSTDPLNMFGVLLIMGVFAAIGLGWGVQVMRRALRGPNTPAG